ncbi:bifunctional hydroxymethylpyrimidine kinase/phosphomethylpyrimidine kinase [Fodinibius halophilus]|uniref:hydroxymethylpyrimidine kinase n=1 Tax=Fodinibius halophilus TaxID=1736908 RepID=A0A6M1SXS0_9BACT|nr:bifunctional hydroxymethylpyrimidine kinase/phosphomethylpyrimidine kinase [Fodinibius halophilus]NGP88698.1 bifunctional hydroxymethylpyrimidine kinase/phosphomethylpyrimidine kinase [Fodinibius halophilus]
MQNSHLPQPTALTIAGSDPSGGAGLQADLKTFSTFGVYGMTAITALTIGNTTGVHDTVTMPAATVYRQIKAVSDDISPHCIKTGLLGSAETIISTADELQKLPPCPLVVDPVMATKRGDVLTSDEEVSAYRSHLVPISDVVTPNIKEAELLSGLTIDTPDGMPDAAKKIMDLGCNAVIIKGGFFADWEQSNDLLYDGTDEIWLHSQRIQTQNTHGTGDAFSAAITALLAKGEDLSKAASVAKDYTSQAIRNNPGLGEGEGPIAFNVSPDQKTV